MTHYVSLVLLLYLLLASLLIRQLSPRLNDSHHCANVYARADDLNRTQGTFDIVGRSGVPAVHAALMQNGQVVFLNRLETYTELRLPNGHYAYSCLYDPVTQGVIPLRCPTNVFCCGGSFLADGQLLTLGGSHALPWLDDTMDQGFDAIRYLDINNFEGGWLEPGNKLSTIRWYASAQTLGDGKLFIAAGSLTAQSASEFENNNPTYEILEQNGVSTGYSVSMEILANNMPRFMYPFLHLLPNGKLFVFVARSSQIFDVKSNLVDRKMPDLEGMYRTYPNTGGSDPEIMICGGGSGEHLYSPTDDSCGRIKPQSNNPQWKMTRMPQSRTMVESVLLLDGTILWINGARQGFEGWGTARDPAMEALIYDPRGDNWTVGGASSIPRLYHSIALLLLDGTVLIAGSNPNDQPLSANEVNPHDPAKAFPTEYRVEIYTPPYLIGDRALRRPSRVDLSTHNLHLRSSIFQIEFSSNFTHKVDVILYHGGFVTHALHMGQVMVYLEYRNMRRLASGRITLEARMPRNITLAPGPYVIYVVVDGIPGIGQFVSLQL